ncbi:ImpB/MucB/SamB family protein [Streptomyces sp. 147326]
MLATMAAAATPPGTTTVIDAKDVERWLRPRPVAALYGVGPATTGKLRTYGRHTIGDFAETPMPTLVRLFGAAGRPLHTHARGQDPRTVQTQPIAKSLAADRAFEHDVLVSAEHRRTLLDLAEEVAARLRDGATSRRRTGPVRPLRPPQRLHPQPHPHGSHGPQPADRRYRVRALRPARPPARPCPRHQPARTRPSPRERSLQQLTLAPGDDHALAIEAVIGRARARYEPGTIRPATSAKHASKAIHGAKTLFSPPPAT